MTTLRARALLFDMDGTIVDSTALVEEIWGRFADEHGVDLAELLAYSHGRKTADTLAHFLPSLPEAERDAITHRINGVESSDTGAIREVPGAGRLLRALDGVRWAVVTSADRTLAELRIAAAGLPPAPVLVPADEIGLGKPDPDGYLRACAGVGVPPSECIVFEDADAGIRAGLAAGAQVVVVGGLDAPAAEGLIRVPDLTGVQVRPEGDWLSVEFGANVPVARAEWPAQESAAGESAVDALPRPEAPPQEDAQEHILGLGEPVAGAPTAHRDDDGDTQACITELG